MAYATWRDSCRSYLAKMDEELGPDATLEERKAELRRRASGFHQGTSWGKQVWSSERRRYLARHGEHPPALAAKSPRLLAAMESGDITFPFRQSS